MDMIPTNIEKVINEFKNRVEKLIGKHLRKIILYGSYARRRF